MTRVPTTSSEISVSDGFDRVEANLLLSLARPYLPAADAEAHHATLRGCRELDWTFLYDQATRHRVTAIVARNFEIHGLPYPSAALREGFRACLVFNRMRNTALREEADEILRRMDLAGLRPLVRKGQYLSRWLYPDLGIRPMSDLDLMVRAEEVEPISAVLAGLGYVQGIVSDDLRTIEPLDRRQQVFWRMNAASQPPFIRLTSDPVVQVHLVDLRHGILEPASGRTVDLTDWFDRAEHVPMAGAAMWVPDPTDLLIDISVHLQREATTLTAIEARKDLCLLRFIDLLMLLRGEDLLAPKVAARVRHYGVEQEVGYALALLTQLYQDTVAQEVSRLLGPIDPVHLNEYGALDGATSRWSTDFRTRLFDNYRFRELQIDAKLVP